MRQRYSSALLAPGVYPGSMSLPQRRSRRLALLLPGLILCVIPALTSCGTEDQDVAVDTATSSSSSDPTADPTPDPTADPTAETESAAPTQTPEAPSESPTDSAVPTATAVPVVPADAPDCSSTWARGAILPLRYKGCVSDAGYIKADVLGCSSGQRIVRYADRWYAVQGGVVSRAGGPLLKDPDYRDMVTDCRG